MTDFVATTEWNFSRKLAFRFFLVFFVLTFFPFPLTEFSIWDPVLDVYDKLWQPVISFIAVYVFHIKHPLVFEATGSSDKTSDYVFLFIRLVLALSVALMWSATERKGTDHNKVYGWLFVYLRYFLALAMFEYGFAKVFATQFPAFRESELLQTYGHSSPMGLLWKFMSYSTGYNLFTGLVEILAGALLLFRRTTLAGALVSVVIMSNVVAINFFYDVPVKIFSVELLLLSLLIAAKDFKRLLNFFILNKPVAPDEDGFRLEKPVLKYARWGLKFLLITSVLYTNIAIEWELQKEYARRPPLYGIYDVQSWEVNGKAIPLVAGDSLHWNRFAISSEEDATLYLMNERKKYVSLELDTTAKEITLNERVFSYRMVDGKGLLLQGAVKDDSVVITTQKMDVGKFGLVNRGFHWVNEYAQNY